MHKEERIGNCLNYLNKIYSLSKDGSWYEPYGMFGLKIKDRTARRGYRVQSYNEIYNVAIRIGKPLLVKLGIIATKKINNKGVYRWNVGKPTKEMVLEIFKAVEVKHNMDDTPTPKSTPVVQKEVIHFEKDMSMDDYFKKLFAEIVDVKTELSDLKSRNSELTKVIAELRHNDNIRVEILNMITKGIMDIGDHNKESEEARLKNFKVFRKHMIDYNAYNNSVGNVLAQNTKMLLSINGIAKSTFDEIIDMRDKKTLRDILTEHQEKLKSEKVTVKG